MSILYVFGKEYAMKYAKEKLGLEGACTTIGFHLQHMYDGNCPIEQINDKYVNVLSQQIIAGTTQLKLSDLDIPDNTFLVIPHYNEEYQNDLDIKNKDLIQATDTVVFVMDEDNYGILAASLFCDKYNIPREKVKYAGASSLQQNILIPVNFQVLYKQTARNLIESNFSSGYKPISKVLYLRLKSKMGRKQFAKYFNIPIRTIEDWEFGKRECTDYIIDLIEYKLEKEKRIIKE